MTIATFKNILTRRLTLLETWAALYEAYAPGDPGLADAAQEIQEQIQALDSEINQALPEERLNTLCYDEEIENLRQQYEKTLSIIHKSHLKYCEDIALERQRILTEMAGLRKSKQLAAQINSRKSEVLGHLDEEA